MTDLQEEGNILVDIQIFIICVMVSIYMFAILSIKKHLKYRRKSDWVIIIRQH